MQLPEPVESEYVPVGVAYIIPQVIFTRIERPDGSFISYNAQFRGGVQIGYGRTTESAFLDLVEKEPKRVAAITNIGE